MKHEIVWSKEAGDELEKIIKYIKDNTGNITATKVSNDIMKAVENISDNPEGRRIAPILQKYGILDVHQLNVNPWIIYYKVENNIMNIVSIIDGRRNLEEILYTKIIEGKIN